MKNYGRKELNGKRSLERPRRTWHDNIKNGCLRKSV